jgi:DNA topoisomerase-1
MPAHSSQTSRAKVLRFFDPVERARTAKRASLRYVCCSDAGIRRVKKGRGFVYLLPSGKRLTNPRDLERIRKLALPPAWTNVWICSDPHGHLQATGYDVKGRKQYRYDARWRSARDEVKYQDLLEFAARLPRLRRELRRDLLCAGLTRDKVLATLVSLMAQTGVRIGNERYCAENGSYGLTTLLDRHAKITTSSVEFAFRGKGGKPYRAAVRDRVLARIVRRCRDIPGQRLFQYVDRNGAYQAIGSGDVNEYVRGLSGARFTAKTFRTWLASVLTLAELRRVAPAATLSARKRQLNQAISVVAEQLGNTLAICRKSYVHPVVMQAFLAGNLPPRQRARRAGLTAEESDLVAVLEKADPAARLVAA